MYFIKYTSIALILLFAVTGCEKKSDRHSLETTTQQQEVASKLLYFNNGEKWLVNDEMKPYILQADSMLISYVSSGSNDYKQLGMQLKEKNDALIKSCTMSGESHEVLHIWLHPHLALTDSLIRASSIEDANKTITALQHSLQLYHTYFE